MPDTPRTLVDTSALISALVSTHAMHAWADQQLTAAEKGQVLISTHTLAEAFKVLTAHSRDNLSPADARQVLEEITGPYEKVSLDHTDYFAVMERCTAQGLSGSVIFDALIAQAALKAGADKLLTLNSKDFKRLGADVAGILVHP